MPQVNLIDMGNLKNVLSNELIATCALVFYKNSVLKGAYVERREIKNGVMGAGKPLNVETLASLLKTVEKFAKDSTSMVSLHGEIPENLLYASTNIDTYKLVWYRKPEKRMLYFSDKLSIPNGEMEVPGLIYVANGSSLDMYAFKGTKPTSKSVLYNAPFFNVDGYVCLGNGKMQKPKIQSYNNWMKYWEDMFWKTEFSHILGENPIKGNLALITKDCIRHHKPFPTSVLVKTDKKLQSLYK